MAIKQQSGFGVMPIILIIAAVVVLGFVGYKVYKAQPSKSVATNNATTNNQTKPVSSQPSNTQTSATPAQTDTYLHIKELGIKVPLTDDIKDLVYSADKQDTAYVLHFSTTSLVAANTNCNAQADPLGTYTAYASEQQNPGTTGSQSGTLEAHVNGYYIYYKHVQYACLTDTNTSINMSATIASLLKAVQNAQKE